jgi:hypothetical protein
MRSPQPNGSTRYPSAMAASGRWSLEAAKTERSTKSSFSSTKTPYGPVSLATATTATQRTISPPYVPPYSNSRIIISPTNSAERCRDCLLNPINHSATSGWISFIPAHLKAFAASLISTPPAPVPHMRSKTSSSNERRSSPLPIRCWSYASLQANPIRSTGFSPWTVRFRRP